MGEVGNIPTVTLAHDYLTQRGGAERVVLSLARAFPEAELFTSLYDRASTFPEFSDVNVRALSLDRVGPLRRRYRYALPLLPGAFSRAHVEADVVVCSSSGWAHGISTDGLKIVYCHSPAKWLYRREDYLSLIPNPAAKAALHMLAPYLRRFDLRSAASADLYLANSTFIAQQIHDVYGIEAEVLAPPPGLGPEGETKPVEGVEPGYYLTVARLVPYKNVARTVDAFRDHPERRLVVVGDGPQRAQLEETAPSNIRFLGEIDDESLRWLYANCEGLVAAGREDFGLTPLEAATFGKPVAALRWGGYPDTVVPGTTGVFFDRAERMDIAAAVDELGSRSWDVEAITGHAETFSESRFIRRVQSIVQKAGTSVASEQLVPVG